ncbi:hypothetical protein, partial [Kurthia sp. ISK08]|uniref:hypothetical protein n=1 Tax=Kurthia sp. ISK08 TaxID=3385835 RepID=UPI0038FD2151
FFCVSRGGEPLKRFKEDCQRARHSFRKVAFALVSLYSFFKVEIDLNNPVWFLENHTGLFVFKILLF